MRPILRRRRPETDPTPPQPAWAKLNLEFAARFVPCEQLTAGQVAHNDQAEAAFVGALTEMGVDLDDPVALHAVLAGLSMGARWALTAPLWAGPQLGWHVNSLAARIPREGDR